MVARILTASASTDAGGRRASSRVLAKAMKVSQSSIVRIWRSHRSEARSGGFAAPGATSAAPLPIRDVRGIYVSSGDRAVVLIARPPAVEPNSAEKELPSGAARPVLPTEAGRRAPRDPLAAVRVLYRTTLPVHRAIHRSRDFLLFLRGVEYRLEPGEEAHLLLRTDQLGREASVLRWLRRHPAFHLYLTPVAANESRSTSIDFVIPESLTCKGVRAQSLRSLPDLIESFRSYSQTYQKHPRPFVWSAPGPRRAIRLRPKSPLSPSSGPRIDRASTDGLAPIAPPREPGLGIPFEPRLITNSLAFMPVRAGLSAAYIFEPNRPQGPGPGESAAESARVSARPPSDIPPDRESPVPRNGSVQAGPSASSMPPAGAAGPRRPPESNSPGANP
jgi:hypothetical protein